MSIAGEIVDELEFTIPLWIKFLTLIVILSVLAVLVSLGYASGSEATVYMTLDQASTDLSKKAAKFTGGTI